LGGSYTRICQTLPCYTSATPAYGSLLIVGQSAVGSDEHFIPIPAARTVSHPFPSCWTACRARNRGEPVLRLPLRAKAVVSSIAINSLPKVALLGGLLYKNLSNTSLLHLGNSCQGQLCTCTVEPRIREKICDRRDLRVSRSRRRFVRQSAGCRRRFEQPGWG
jgi:hypothetical protein